jgi:hypothetical protein
VSIAATPVPDAALWRHASQRLLAKMIAELAWEGAFALDRDGEGGFELRLAGGVRYGGRAWRSIWDMPVIDPESLSRIEDAGLSLPTTCCALSARQAPRSGSARPICRSTCASWSRP